MYEDEDTFGAEIAELYSYTEGPEFHLAQKAFEDEASSFNLPITWTAMEDEQKCSMIQLLLDRTEVASRDERLAAIRGKVLNILLRVFIFLLVYLFNNFFLSKK